MSQRNLAGGGRGISWSPEEEAEFAAIFGVCWALRGTDAYRPALEMLAEWHAELPFRRAQTFVAHRTAGDGEIERLVDVLRATDPDRLAAIPVGR
jgi:hypothetical protein